MSSICYPLKAITDLLIKCIRYRKLHCRFVTVFSCAQASLFIQHSFGHRWHYRQQINRRFGRPLFSSSLPSLVLFFKSRKDNAESENARRLFFENPTFQFWRSGCPLTNFITHARAPTFVFVIAVAVIRRIHLFLFFLLHLLFNALDPTLFFYKNQ